MIKSRAVWVSKVRPGGGHQQSLHWYAAWSANRVPSNGTSSSLSLQWSQHLRCRTFPSPKSSHRIQERRSCCSTSSPKYLSPPPIRSSCPHRKQGPTCSQARLGSRRKASGCLRRTSALCYHLEASGSTRDGMRLVEESQVECWFGRCYFWQ